MGSNQDRLTTTLQDLRDNRLSIETRKNYRSGIRQLEMWLRASGRDSMLADDGSIDLNVFRYDDFADFIVHKFTTAHSKPGTLASYRSAIKDYYQRKRVRLPEEFETDIKCVFQGKSLAL